MTEQRSFVGMITKEEMDKIRSHEDVGYLADQNMTWTAVNCDRCGVPGHAIMSTTISVATGDADDLGVDFFCTKCVESHPDLRRLMLISFDDEILSWFDQIQNEEEVEAICKEICLTVMHGKFTLAPGTNSDHRLFHQCLETLITAITAAKDDDQAPKGVNEYSARMLYLTERLSMALTPGKILDLLATHIRSSRDHKEN